MANSKITGLPAASALTGVEPLPVVQSATTKQSTISAILTYITANISLAASAITSGALALARGGTGASLSDPNADRIMFWDDSAGAVDWLTAGSGLSISGTTISTTVNIFRAERTTNQSVSSGSAKVQVNSEIFDTGNNYDPTTNYRWTPPAGAVSIQGSVQWASATAFGNTLGVMKNGAEITSAKAFTTVTTTGPWAQVVSLSDYANGTDYYELLAAQVSGGPVNITTASFSGISYG